MLYEINNALAKEKPSKDELVSLIYTYDSFEVYHRLFELHGEGMGKEEYIFFLNRYLRIFDLSFAPLPEICEELNKKWGIKNVSD